MHCSNDIPEDALFFGLKPVPGLFGRLPDGVMVLYVLLDPRDAKAKLDFADVRWVGVTRRLRSRIRMHRPFPSFVQRGKNLQYLEWLLELSLEGLRPAALVLAVLSLEDAIPTEARLIRLLLHRGGRLLNIQSGWTRRTAWRPTWQQGQIVRAFRKVQGLTQKQMAQLAGISTPVVCRIESGDACGEDSFEKVKKAMQESRPDLFSPPPL
jgi:DNA-binding XRE family transcriptional regulator